MNVTNFTPASSFNSFCRRLTVELTESSTLEDPALAETVVRELDALGLKIALDDFGTGYASISYVRRFAFDTLKLDRSFVAGMIDSEEDAADDIF